MLKLSHLVDDKIHARSIGPYSLVTQHAKHIRDMLSMRHDMMHDMMQEMMKGMKKM